MDKAQAYLDLKGGNIKDRIYSRLQQLRWQIRSQMIITLKNFFLSSPTRFKSFFLNIFHNFVRVIPYFTRLNYSERFNSVNIYIKTPKQSKQVLFFIVLGKKFCCILKTFTLFFFKVFWARSGVKFVEGGFYKLHYTPLIFRFLKFIMHGVKLRSFKSGY